MAAVHLTVLYFCCYEIPVGYYIFVGCGTFVIYNLHRLFSLFRINKLGNDLEERFYKIRHYKSFYIVSSSLCALLCLYYFIEFSWTVKFLVCAPTLIALLYILPIFPGKKRLRDYNFLKIFLIAFSWSWLCCVVPLHFSSASSGLIIGLGIEKFLFISAIALPFDFRDLHLDEQQSVETLVSSIGYKNAMILGILCLIIAIGLMGVLTYGFHLVRIPVFYGMAIAYIIIAFILSQAFKEHNDYYYTFLVDGSMIITLICVLVMMAIA